MCEDVFGDWGRVPRNVREGLASLPKRMELSGDLRRVVTMRATDPVPDGLGAGDVLSAWFMSDWAESTVMLRTVKLVEAKQKTGCGLAFVGIHRRAVPRELSDQVEIFIN